MFIITEHFEPAYFGLSQDFTCKKPLHADIDDIFELWVTGGGLYRFDRDFYKHTAHFRYSRLAVPAKEFAAFTTSKGGCRSCLWWLVLRKKLALRAAPEWCYVITVKKRGEK